MSKEFRESLSLSFTQPELSSGVWRVLAIGGFMNFLAFLLGSYALGGEALNGLVRGGSFFLANHGQYTQVSETTYWLSYLHGLSAVVGLLAGAFAVSRLDRRKDPVFRRWSRPLGTVVLFFTGFAALVAWSFALPARFVIPGLLLLAGGAGVALVLDRRTDAHRRGSHEGGAAEQGDEADEAR